MQSDAKSAFCKKGHQNERPGLHFGSLWGSLWSTLALNGGSEGSRETDLKNRSAVLVRLSQGESL